MRFPPGKFALLRFEGSGPYKGTQLIRVNHADTADPHRGLTMSATPYDPCEGKRDHRWWYRDQRQWHPSRAWDDTKYKEREETLRFSLTRDSSALLVHLGCLFPLLRTRRLHFYAFCTKLCLLRPVHVDLAEHQRVGCLRLLGLLTAPSILVPA